MDRHDVYNKLYEIAAGLSDGPEPELAAILREFAGTLLQSTDPELGQHADLESKLQAFANQKRAELEASLRADAEAAHRALEAELSADVEPVVHDVQQFHTGVGSFPSVPFSHLP